MLDIFDVLCYNVGKLVENGLTGTLRMFTYNELLAYSAVQPDYFF